MFSRLFVVAFLVGTIVFGSATGNAGPIVSPTTQTPLPQAPIGHLQPRAEQLVAGYVVFGSRDASTRFAKVRAVFRV